MISTKNQNEAKIEERIQKVRELLQMVAEKAEEITGAARSVATQLNVHVWDAAVCMHSIKDDHAECRKAVEDLGRLISAVEFQEKELRAEISQGLGSELGKVSRVLFATFPWLPARCSVNQDWVWTLDKTRRCGYCGEDDQDAIGCVGLEDAVYLFEEQGGDVYEACEVLQKAFDEAGLPFWLEPYYNFLWVIRRNGK